MIKAILCLMALLAFQPAWANLCSQRLVDDARRVLQSSQALFDVGMGSSYEVMMSEKYLLETELCVNPQDFAAFSALAKNVVWRLDAAKRDGDAGGNVGMGVMIRAEKAALAHYCAKDLKNTALAFFDKGQLDQFSLSQLSETCALLSR